MCSNLTHTRALKTLRCKIHKMKFIMSHLTTVFMTVGLLFSVAAASRSINEFEIHTFVLAGSDGVGYPDGCTSRFSKWWARKTNKTIRIHQNMRGYVTSVGDRTLHIKWDGSEHSCVHDTSSDIFKNLQIFGKFYEGDLVITDGESSTIPRFTMGKIIRIQASDIHIMWLVVREHSYHYERSLTSHKDLNSPHSKIKYLCTHLSNNWKCWVDQDGRIRYMCTRNKIGDWYDRPHCEDGEEPSIREICRCTNTMPSMKIKTVKKSVNDKYLYDEIVDTAQRLQKESIHDTRRRA